MDRSHEDVPGGAGSTRRTVLRGGALLAGTTAVWTAPVVSVLGISPLSAAQASTHEQPPPPPPPVFSGGRWTVFAFGAEGSTFSIPTFTAPAGGARVRIVDVLFKGDEFELYEGPVLLGRTSDVPPSTTNTTSNPDTAWGDPTYSKGTSLVGPGEHSLTIRTFQSPYGKGDAFYRVDFAV